jgi:hypothetical protein
MSPAVGPFFVGAVLLVVGGILKARDPRDTANALRGVGLPISARSVRIGALGEVAIGVYALARGDFVAASLVASSYVAFVGFVVAALRRDAPIATCGCFGKIDTPPSPVHVGCCALLAIAAGAVMAQPGAGIVDVVRDQPMAGLPFLVLVATGAALTFLALSALPRLSLLVRSSAGG